MFMTIIVMICYDNDHVCYMMINHGIVMMTILMTHDNHYM